MLPNGHLLGWKSKAKNVFPRWGLRDKVAEELIDMTDLLCKCPPWLSHMCEEGD